MNFELIPVRGKALSAEFINFPKRLYKNDANYIMPLDKDIQMIFDPARNPTFSTGDCVRWILKRDNETVGRIAAFYTKVQKTGKLMGGCGFFECIDSQDAANMLFDAARDWVKSEGCDFMDGPVNFGERDSFWGLMVGGFNNPSYRENYNFPYYQVLFENYGFKPEIGQTTSLISESTFNFERFSKLSTRVFSNPVYTFDYLRKNNLEKYADDFIKIYNQAWSFHENFIPMTHEKIMVHMKQMLPILVEELNIFVYANGEPVGFYITVLDVNQIFKHVNGKMNLLGKLKFLYYRPKVTRIRGIVFGVVPKYHNLGLEIALIMKFREAMMKNTQFKDNELAWVGDFNPKMLSMFESMGAREIKKHVTYRYHFT
mgnify:CR=1 FL=1